MRESTLLEHICADGRAWPPRVTVPPGDDLASVRFGEDEVLMGTDQVADGIHFDLARCPLSLVARKALTRNLSDVAAMAAVPVCALVATMLPRDFPQPRALELVDHLNAVAAAFACPLVGGDIGMWDGPLQLTVTVLAEPDGIAPVLRRGARSDDVIFVSGDLGGSLEETGGAAHHLDFDPRLDLARRLAGDARTRPHCMIDLSDGLAVDLRHLCAAAGLAAEVDVARLPIARAAAAAANRSGRAAWEHAAGDGEDYELLFTVDPEQAASLPARSIDGVRLSRIGRMVPADGTPAVRFRLPDGALRGAAELGWEHRGP